MVEKFRINKDFNNSRFDRWFKKEVIDLPQSLIEKLIRKKKIKVNNKIIKRSYRVLEDDIIEIFGLNKLKIKKRIEKQKYIPSNKEKKGFNDFIIEDNDNFIVINKPPGIPVQGGTKSFKNVIDSFRSTDFFKDTKPYVVHRIDKDTSGILIIAKNRRYAQLLTSLFRIRKIHKTYLAIVHGKPILKKKVLEDDLVIYDKNKKVVQKAVSYFRILKSNEKYSLIELNPVTGRKHQIRKQLSNIGTPIVGDKKYGFKEYQNKNSYLFLHAYQLKFMINDEKYSYKAKYNTTFENFISKFIKSY